MLIFKKHVESDDYYFTTVLFIRARARQPNNASRQPVTDRNGAINTRSSHAIL